MQSKVLISSVKQLYAMAFTHKNLPVETLGLLHIEQENYENRLKEAKNNFDLSELYYLSTCNRVEFAFVTEGDLTDPHQHARNLLTEIYPNISEESFNLLIENAIFHKGIDVVEHLISVAASIDSMVVGEREIITQVRKAFETCHAAGLTGDKLRLVMKQVLETAKKVYSQTSISQKPVSVVSLAYQELKRFQIPLNARIVVIGSGATNTTLCRFLKKHGFRKFSVFNRTLSNAEKLAQELGGTAHKLNELEQFTEGFDVLVTCTSSDHHIVNQELYQTLLNGDTSKKIIIDLAIPQDIDPFVLDQFSVHYISIAHLQKVSNENLKIRQGELSRVHEIIQKALVEFDNLYKERKVELVMQEVPEEVKKIKDFALNEVFKTELQNLDPQSRELLEKIVGYMEKKYISGPMKKAKEILLSNVQKHEN
ncbi:MAG: glutamyl-tRNA reductase [Crocinitomicaceae bacterium]